MPPIALQLQGDFGEFFSERGVTAGPWYALESETGGQRNYRWTCPETGMEVTGIERREEVGLSVQECLVANAAAEAAAIDAAIEAA